MIQTNIEQRQEYECKIGILEMLITEYETGSDKFNVINFEAGFGKSRESNRIIGEYIANFLNTRKFLLVKKFDLDVIHSAMEINKIAKEKYTWGYISDDFALGIVADNWRQYQSKLDKLKETPILIITHERYHRLFYQTKIQQVFAEGRHTLILDEQPSEPIFTFSEKIYKDILSKVPGELLLDKKFAKICQPIFEAINIMKTKTNNIESIKLINKRFLRGNFKLINEFKEIISNRDNIVELIENNLYVDNILQFLRGVEIIYKNQCVYSDGRVSSYDQKFWYWTLDNNIIMDANAFVLDKRYYLQDDIFVRYHQSRIFDHIKSKLFFIDLNTSRIKINRYDNYYDEILRYIKMTMKENDKILIVTQLKEKEPLDKKLEEYELNNLDDVIISVAWFGNIVGKNDWRDFNKVFIIAAPNIPIELHILQWAFWSRKKISSQMNFKTTTKNKIFQFRNEELEKTRKGFIASALYQAIARVNRSVELEAEYYIFYNDEDIFNMVSKNFPNCKIDKSISLDIEMIHKSDKEKKPTVADKLYEYLLELPSGQYKKKDIENKLNLHSHLSRHLSFYKIVSLIDSGKINVKHHTISVN